MDKIEKALKRLSEKEREWVRAMLIQIQSSNYEGLNVKKLKGRDDIYRARKGDIRIVYRQTEGKIFILTIERRNEKTYS
ncbi:MAG: hypothetical protein AAB602_03095 [Patescibacteria group bacterium]